MKSLVPQKKRRFWLMKSEPACFSFADLQSRPGGVEHWDGVRNYQARNFLRDEIKVGDGILFYHSNIAEPAIVGIAEVVRSGYPDFTALDPEGEHFDPRATEKNPIWYMVDVRAVEELFNPLTRTFLALHPELQGMSVLKKGNRLSVQEVTATEWTAVIVAGGVKNKESKVRGNGR